MHLKISYYLIIHVFMPLTTLEIEIRKMNQASHFNSPPYRRPIRYLTKLNLIFTRQTIRKEEKSV